MRQLYIDCDGVLADFDSAAHVLLGRPAAKHEAIFGTADLYERLRTASDFFTNLQPMPRAFALWAALRQYAPTILTGQPPGEWARAQKLAWRDAHFPGAPMVVCYSHDKRAYCQPGDVLLDDRTKYAHLWRDAGGVFIHYDATRPLAETVQAVHRAMRTGNQVVPTDFAKAAAADEGLLNDR